MSEINVDLVIGAYVATRAKIKELKEQIAELEALQSRKEEWLNQQMFEAGVDSMKTKHGTVYTTTFESCTVADREVFMDWVVKNEAWSFLENRVAKAEALNYMGDRENGSRPNSPPPGINYVALKKVNVRRG